MSDSLLLTVVTLSALPLIGVGVWSACRDNSTFVGRLLIFGFAVCALWGVSLGLLVDSAHSPAFRIIWLPSVTLTAAAIYMLTKVANDPAWRPHRWVVGPVAAESVAMSVLTLTNDRHRLIAQDLDNSLLEYAWAFGAHMLFCAALLGLAAVEMSRRLKDPQPWMRGFAVMIMLLVAATCAVQVLQIRISQSFATIALIAFAFAAQRGGLGHRDPALNQAFDPNDPVTGVLSRRSIEKLLTDLPPGAAEQAYILVIDVDRFKGVNDTFGHLAGDLVLRTVASRLSDQEPRMTLGRWGGDEFVGLLRDIPAVELPAIVEDLAASCSAAPIITVDGRPIAISVSIGSASCAGGNWHTWISTADAAMYAAKELRRDRTMPFDRRS